MEHGFKEKDFAILKKFMGIKDKEGNRALDAVDIVNLFKLNRKKN